MSYIQAETYGNNAYTYSGAWRKSTKEQELETEVAWLKHELKAAQAEIHRLRNSRRK